MQDYKEALALAAEKESKKIQPKPNGMCVIGCRFIIA